LLCKSHTIKLRKAESEGFFLRCTSCRPRTAGPSRWGGNNGHSSDL